MAKKEICIKKTKEDMKLDLSPLQIDIYCYIKGVSKNKGKFWGSIGFLADLTNTHKPYIVKCLKILVEKGFLIKEEHFNGKIKYCSYTISQSQEKIEQNNTVNYQWYETPTLEEVTNWYETNKQSLNLQTNPKTFHNYFAFRQWKDIEDIPIRDWRSMYVKFNEIKAHDWTIKTGNFTKY